MECGYCREKLEMALVMVGPGFQVSASCDKCGGVWVTDVYSLGSMALIQAPQPSEENDPDPLPSIESVFEKYLGPLPELPEEPAPEDEAELRYDGVEPRDDSDDWRLPLKHPAN